MRNKTLPPTTNLCYGESVGDEEVPEKICVAFAEMRQREGEEGRQEEDGVHHSQDQHQPESQRKSVVFLSLKQRLYLWKVFCCFKCAKNVVLKNIVHLIYLSSRSILSSPFSGLYV